MSACKAIIGAVLAAAAACGSAGEQPGAADSAAVRMERDGAVTEKTLPSGEVDTAVVSAPAGQP